MFHVFTLWLNYNRKTIKFKNLDLDRGLMTTLLVIVSYTMCACVLSPSVMSSSLRPHGLQPSRLFYP